MLLGKVFREEKTGCIVRRPEEIGVNRYSPVFLYVFSRHHIPGFNLLKPYGLSFREKTQFFSLSLGWAALCAALRSAFFKGETL